MSASRRNKKNKPINLEEQPVIRQFIVDSGHSENPDKSDCKWKKRRRSTGQKNSENKCCNSNSVVTTDDTYKPKEGIAHMDTTTNMTDTQEETSNTTSIMLAEIMKMEERLAAKITLSKDQGLSDMEERLNNNIRSTIAAQSRTP